MKPCTVTAIKCAALHGLRFQYLRDGFVLLVLLDDGSSDNRFAQPVASTMAEWREFCEFCEVKAK